MPVVVRARRPGDPQLPAPHDRPSRGATVLEVAGRPVLQGRAHDIALQAARAVELALFVAAGGDPARESPARWLGMDARVRAAVEAAVDSFRIGGHFPPK